jgi:site-specific recombinase XerC
MAHTLIPTNNRRNQNGNLKPYQKRKALQQGQADRPKTTTKAQRNMGNLRAVQILLGHTKMESTVKYLGIEVNDALEMAEQTEV